MCHPYFAAFRTYVKQLNLPWHHYQMENLRRLGGAFLERRSLPLRRLARTLAGPGPQHRAADKRLRRFLGNPRLDEKAQDAAVGCLLRFLLPRLGAVEFVPVMFDWLFVDGHALLGLQLPYRGREGALWAMVCFSVHPATFEANEPDRTKAELALLERLRGCWPVDAPPPVLLCDRGFAKGELVQWLQQRRRCFIIRVPRSHHLYSRHGQLLNDPADADPEPSRRGLLHPPLGKGYLIPHVTYTAEWRRPVHLAVTAKLDPKTGKRREWRLITNLEEAALRHVPRLYGYRMSPEETHRDYKRGHAVGGFALCHLGRMRRDRLQRYLLVLSLLRCFLVLVAETEREAREWLKRQHWGLGLLTMGLDLLHAAGKSAVRLARQACASVTLEPLWVPGGYS
jgi:hypothetical protein